MRYDVISADNHFNEPGDTFVARVPTRLKEHAPRIVPTADGGEAWQWEGQAPGESFGLSSAVWQRGEARTRENYILSGLKHSELAAGSYDPKATIEDMAA